MASLSAVLGMDSNGQLHYGQLGDTFPGVVSTLYTSQSTAPVGNTTTPTTLLPTVTGTKTLGANFWQVGRTIRLETRGVYSSSITTGGATLTVKLGATTLASVTISSLANAATNLTFQGLADIVCYTTGSSGTLGIVGGLQFSTGVTGTAFADLSNAGTALTIDTTVSNTLDILFSWSSLVTGQAVKTVSATGIIMN